MMYETIKDFMKNIPDAMFIDITADATQPANNSFVKRYQLPFVEDAAKVEKLNADVALTANKTSCNKHCNMNTDSSVYASNVVRTFMTTDNTAIIIHDTIGSYYQLIPIINHNARNGKSEEINYIISQGITIGNKVASNLSQFIAVNHFNFFYFNTKCNVIDIYVVITTSRKAVSTITTMACEQHCAQNNIQMKNFYLSILDCDWKTYQLDYYSPGVKAVDKMWTVPTYIDSTIDDFDEIVVAFNDFIIANAIYHFAVTALSHFTNGTYNKYEIQRLNISDEYDVDERADSTEDDSSIEISVNWVLKKFRKLIPLEGSGNDIRRHLQRIIAMIKYTRVQLNAGVNDKSMIVTNLLTRKYPDFIEEVNMAIDNLVRTINDHIE